MQVVGATNRPQELDEAARRRLVRRLYIPLPDAHGRGTLIRRLLRKEKHELTDEQINNIVEQTKGYSGADIKSLCTDAGMPCCTCMCIRAWRLDIEVYGCRY